MGGSFYGERPAQKSTAKAEAHLAQRARYESG